MPLATKTFDQLLDFTRTTSGTFVGSNGLIQTTPASVNLFTFTQQFDNVFWSKTAATVTANSTVAPDGTSTADTLTEDTTAASTHRVFKTLAGAVVAHTASIYFKAGTRSWGYIRLADGGSAFRHAYFNLSTGALGTVETNLTASIEPAGNGWYRCVATVNATINPNTTVFGIADADGGATYNGDGTGSIFLWGAQLQTGSTATTYTRNNGGVFPPRFDYDPVTLAPKGLLVEEQRTNLLLQSETFDSGTWNKFQATITANATVSPDGTADADALIEDANTGTHLCQQFFTFANATAYTMSAYVKAGTRAWCTLLFPSAAFGSSIGSYFNLSGAGALGTAIGSPTSRSITAVGNGWYRVTITATATAAAGGNLPISAASADNTNSYTGVNGTTAISIYGAQLEAGSFATSYIPTVASQVTRTGDFTSIVAPNFASWYNQSEGTFVVEYSRYQNADAFGVILETKPASTSTADRFAVAATSTADPRMQLYPNGSSVLDTTSTFGVLAVNTVVKGALAYRSGDSAATRNGASPSTSATAFATPAHTGLQIGSTDNGNYGPVTTTQLNGHIRSITYYPTRLTNAQLQALTA